MAVKKRSVKTLESKKLMRLNYLDDDNGFFYNIVDFCLKQVQQYAHTALCRLLQTKEKRCNNPTFNGF